MVHQCLLSLAVVLIGHGQEAGGGEGGGSERTLHIKSNNPTLTGGEQIHTILANNVNFCEFCEKDARFQKGVVIFANSAKTTRTFPERGCHFCEFCEKDARFQKGDIIFVISAKNARFPRVEVVFGETC